MCSQLSSIVPSTRTGEWYLTDLIARASNEGRKIVTIEADFDLVRGINTRTDFSEVEQLKRSQLVQYWTEKGVHFSLPSTVYIDTDVVLEPDIEIGAGVHLLGKTMIKEGCSIGPYTVLEDVTVGSNVTIKPHSVITQSVIGAEASVGPFTRLRDGVYLDQNVVIGNFVEIKKSSLGSKTKVKHLSYVGDTSVGNSVTIGAGSITCNYDGTTKQKTVIKHHAFVGSNTTLIAPLCIGEGSFIAAGSVITQSVPYGDLALAREHQVNKKGYAKKIRTKSAYQYTISPVLLPTRGQIPI